MSSSSRNHKNQEMAKAYTILGFTLDNLQLLQGHDDESTTSMNNYRVKIVSLYEDLKYMRSLIGRMQEQHKKVEDLVANNLHEVEKLLVSTDFWVKWYILKPIKEVNIDASPNTSPYKYFLLRFGGDDNELMMRIKDITGQISRERPEHKAVTKAHVIVDLAINYMKMLLRYRKPFQLEGQYREREKLQIIKRDLMDLRFDIGRVPENSDLEDKIVDVVGQFLDWLDEYLHGPILNDMQIPGRRDLLLSSTKITDLVQILKYVELEEVLMDVEQGGGVGSSSASTLPTPNGDTIVEERVVVIGMEGETRMLLNKILQGSKQLQVIPVIGMAGIGKTTLARKLYNDVSIAGHFYIRTWSCVSQSYQKRKLLSDLLSTMVGGKDPVLSMSEEDMEQKLYRCLIGRRYLIVLDDVWDVQVLEELRMCLPKDDNSSRVFVTSRNKDVIPKELISEYPPHFLRLLTEDESWDLFRYKVFGSASFPEELMQVGKEIVATCKGLPIAIVVMGGLLAKEEKTTEKWTEFAQTNNRSSSTKNDFNQLMDILASSYEHLPFPLKSCFLFLGSFPEDYEYPVKWLIRSWIAQGFIEPTPEMELEDVSESYLMNLIDRSLLIVTKRRSDGGIKSCQIHDLIRDVCIKKAGEKKFLQPICRCQSSNASLQESLEFFKAESFFYSRCQYYHFYNSDSILSDMFTESADILGGTPLQFLSVLDIRRGVFDEFPKKIFTFFHLKLLAFHVDRIENLPDSLFDLWNLETFILVVDKGGKVELVASIRKLRRLRHFHVSKELFCDPRNWLVFYQRRLSIHVLENLQTISKLSASDSTNTLLSITPNLRNLGLHGTLSMTNNDPVVFPALSNLKLLETLKFEYQTLGMETFTIPSLVDFPKGLKKLTLIGSHVEWSAISIIAGLPNLQVLKLKDNFFSGPRWETTDHGAFQCLKFLKLSHMDLKEWVCSSETFPKLEQLVLNGCLDLEEIPIEIADIYTLQAIMVYRSSDSVAESAKEIQKIQNSLGNCDFNVSIFEHFQEF